MFSPWRTERPSFCSGLLLTPCDANTQQICALQDYWPASIVMRRLISAHRGRLDVSIMGLACPSLRPCSSIHDPPTRLGVLLPILHRSSTQWTHAHENNIRSAIYSRTRPSSRCGFFCLLLTTTTGPPTSSPWGALHLSVHAPTAQRHGLPA